MGKKKRAKKAPAQTSAKPATKQTQPPAGGTRLVAGLLLAGLAVMVGGVLAVLESVKAALMQQTL